MKNKKIILPSFLIIALFGFVNFAKADLNVGGTVDVKTGTSVNAGGVKTNSDTEVNGSSDVKTEDNNKSTDNAEYDKNDSKDKEDQGDDDTNEKSDVAKFVSALKSIADKDKKIGGEVSAVATAQSDSDDVKIEAMDKIKTRGGFKTFLIGTDYTSIGVLRSTLVTTQNSIDRLTKAMASVTDASVKAQLAAEIKVLQDNQVKVDAFIKANEGKFSLFGWLARIFE